MKKKTIQLGKKLFLHRDVLVALNDDAAQINGGFPPASMGCTKNHTPTWVTAQGHEFCMCCLSLPPDPL
ncbi:class I lanthipeptide [Chitinophaga nivalis]|uniref:Class I lanthipeptide n=1 Tax=Chitinophaga nivalis TaxID=2991709 RepID=A0ABT3IGS7_9BACT|nr:class I lanthipeptide [Chitinophaga nivalis]MCW3467139.1 class I lanthipeptide [Chitinophaga nivalis]MCW3483170.1 class I lanthipeptide [Chitinophaga nivalis]